MDFCTVTNPFFRFLTVYGQKDSGEASAKRAIWKKLSAFHREHSPLPAKSNARYKDRKQRIIESLHVQCYNTGRRTDLKNRQNRKRGKSSWNAWQQELWQQRWSWHLEGRPPLRPAIATAGGSSAILPAPSVTIRPCTARMQMTTGSVIILQTKTGTASVTTMTKRFGNSVIRHAAADTMAAAVIERVWLWSLRRRRSRYSWDAILFLC